MQGHEAERAESQAAPPDRPGSDAEHLPAGWAQPPCWTTNGSTAGSGGKVPWQRPQTLEASERCPGATGMSER